MRSFLTFLNDRTPPRYASTLWCGCPGREGPSSLVPSTLPLLHSFQNVMKNGIFQVTFEWSSKSLLQEFMSWFT